MQFKVTYSCLPPDQKDKAPPQAKKDRELVFETERPNFLEASIYAQQVLDSLSIVWRIVSIEEKE